MQWRPKQTTSKQQPRPRTSAPRPAEPAPRTPPPPPEPPEPSRPRQQRRGQRGQARSKKKVKLSRLKKPAGMSLEDWQIELRKQFGR